MSIILQVEVMIEGLEAFHIQQNHGLHFEGLRSGSSPFLAVGGPSPHAAVPPAPEDGPAPEELGGSPAHSSLAQSPGAPWLAAQCTGEIPQWLRN